MAALENRKAAAKCCGRSSADSQATPGPGLAAVWLHKNLSASVNELSDEQLSGFSNISTTLRRASSFNPSSPGGEIISRCGLSASTSATASAAGLLHPDT